MYSHSVEVFGLELSFKSEAEPGRIEHARALLSERYGALAQHGGQVSKERLLAFLALSLADDIILLKREQAESRRRVQELLGELEKVAE